jgi:Na+-driven multidrug efflux pump
LRFFSTDPQILHHGTLALRIIGFGYIFYGIGMVMVQALNGAGDTRTPTWINLFSFWMFQIPFAFLLSKYSSLGVIGVYIAIPVAETTIALLAWYYFSRGNWKKIHI